MDHSIEEEKKEDLLDRIISMNTPGRRRRNNKQQEEEQQDERQPAVSSSQSARHDPELLFPLRHVDSCVSIQSLPSPEKSLECPMTPITPKVKPKHHHHHRGLVNTLPNWPPPPSHNEVETTTRISTRQRSKSFDEEPLFSFSLGGLDDSDDDDDFSKENDASTGLRNRHKRTKSHHHHRRSKATPSRKSEPPSLMHHHHRLRSFDPSSSSSSSSFSQHQSPASSSLLYHHHQKQQQQQRSRFIIPVEHPLKVIWDIVTIIFSLAYSYATHIAISRKEYSYSPFLTFCDIWFGIDILLNFITERQISHKPVIILKDHRSIVARYLTTWFVVDSLSLVPWQMLYVQPIVTVQKRRNFFQKSFFRSRAVLKVTSRLRGKHFKLFNNVAARTKQHGVGASRLLRLIIKYTPKYVLFLKNMKGAVPLRVLRQYQWLRRFYRNIVLNGLATTTATPDDDNGDSTTVTSKKHHLHHGVTTEEGKDVVEATSTTSHHHHHHHHHQEAAATAAAKYTTDADTVDVTSHPEDDDDEVDWEHFDDDDDGVPL